MAILFVDELQKDHYAPLFSKQTFITYIFVFVTVVLPFFLIVPTHSKCESRIIDIFRLLGN